MTTDLRQELFDECLRDAPELATALAIALNSGEVVESSRSAKIPDVHASKFISEAMWREFRRSRWSPLARQIAQPLAVSYYRVEGDIDRPIDRKPAIFLDRDGTMIELVPYLKSPEGVRLKSGLVELLRTAKNAGYRLICVTNQSGLGRGYYTLAEFSAVQDEMCRQLAALGVGIDGTYFSGFYPDSRLWIWRAMPDLRKPGTAMCIEAGEDHNIDLARSIMIGDSMADLGLGLNVGMSKTIIVAGSAHEQQVDTERIPSEEDLRRPGVIPVATLAEATLLVDGFKENA